MAIQKKTFVTILLTLAGALLLVVAGALITAYSGVVNVAATNPPSALTSWFLTTTRAHSVASRASDIQVPDLDDPRLLQMGADHYQEMCVGCHGAPGTEAGEAAQGLEPSPPKLGAGPPMTMRDAAEAFWIVKHGVKMTGMPAFGKTHDDEKIWAIVAFVRRLRSMSPEEYRSATMTGGDAEPGDGSETGKQHEHDEHTAHEHHEAHGNE